MKHTLRFAQGSDAVVEGLLVPYGGSFRGRDSYGTFASPRTDFCLEWFDRRPFLYHHGLDDAIRAVPIGVITELTRVDKGVWMKAQLDKRHEYFREVKDLIDDDELGLSSGTIGHLAKIDERTGEWIMWPIAEGSATPTESNLLATFDVATAKSHFRAAGIELPADVAAKLPREGDPNDFRTYIWTPDESSRKAPAAAAPGGQAPNADAAGANPVAPSRDAPTPPAPGLTRTGAGAEPVLAERSFEDIRDDINDLLWHHTINTYDGSYDEPCYVVQTFADYVIVCYWEDGEISYWKIAYSLDDNNEPVLGDKWEMELVYVPVTARTSTAPLTLDANTVTRTAAALAQRTEDLSGRRDAEGRPLSAGNRAALQRAAKGLTDTAGKITALVTRAQEREAAAAEAARYADPEARRAKIALLELEAFAAG